MVEGEGFEPSVRCRTHAFQASSFDRSDILPKKNSETANKSVFYDNSLNWKLIMAKNCPY